MIRTLLVTLGLLAGASQDVKSGPDKGASVAALKVHDCTGQHKDMTVDYAGERKDKPTIYLLVQAEKFDRPMNRLMKTVDSMIKKDHPDVYAVAVWLTDDVDKTRVFLPRVQQSVQYEAPVLTCYTGKNGPKDWNVNSDAHLTVVVADKGKVTAVFAFLSANETDAAAVIEVIRKK